MPHSNMRIQSPFVSNNFFPRDTKGTLDHAELKRVERLTPRKTPRNTGSGILFFFRCRIPTTTVTREAKWSAQGQVQDELVIL